ncbi:unnamed protein product [Clonostachys chloroleuca]|uniref:Uncharacterized protein n=1 Tax=Clonostachys chloroleuca TaxID=1926264 RepID=A0AA35LXC8_9HYPO|nr:unnamed protein product [Clonostachys chloroleuca]
MTYSHLSEAGHIKAQLKTSSPTIRIQSNIISKTLQR